MKKTRYFTILLILTVLLSGCARKTPVETAFNEVQESVVALKGSLPVECQTEMVLNKIEQIELKRQKAETACEVKIKDLEVKYERALIALFVILFVFFAKIFIKK